MSKPRGACCCCAKLFNNVHTIIGARTPCSLFITILYTKLYSAEVWANNCTERRTSKQLTASKCTIYVYSLKKNYESMWIGIFILLPCRFYNASYEACYSISASRQECSHRMELKIFIPINTKIVLRLPIRRPEYIRAECNYFQWIP